MTRIASIILLSFMLSCNSDKQTMQDGQQRKIDSLSSELEKKKSEETKTKQAVEEVARKQKIFRNSWSSNIVAKMGTYKVNDLGGISDLRLYVKNTSEYQIDDVDVVVTYITANGYAFKTESVHFLDIPANSVKELMAPNSERGLSVSISIKSVRAKAFKFCYDKENIGTRSLDDPWLCK
jgi:hypothetical protein